MARSKFYRSTFSMYMCAMCACFNVFVRMSDSPRLFSFLFLMLSVAFFVHGYFLKDGFSEQDFLSEKRWKNYAGSRFIDASYVLFALFVTSVIALIAIIIGRSTGTGDYESITIGIFSSATLQIICDICRLNKQDRQLKPQISPVDHLDN